jgi:phosphoglycerol transferase MdoB-like AlkP superfamily enzyme
MISTVTTSTVSTVTIAGSLALVGILLLLVFLILKETSTASSTGRSRTVRQVLNIGLAPLGIAFIIIAITKVIQVLR